ncbi:hypothetical protein ES703_26798 [subsurface metagenome]
MGKRIVAMSLVLVMVLSFTTCGKGVELPSAQEIVDGAIQALDNIRAYEFEIAMSMDVTGEAEGEAFEMTMVTDSSGAFDLANRQMRMDMAMSVVLPGEDEVDMEIELYLIDSTGYIMMDVPGIGPVWEKEELSEADWEETVEMLSLAEPQIEILETAEVEVIGSEKIGGIDCYVVEITPDMEQFWETVMQQATLGFVEEMGLPMVTEEILDEVSYSFSAKQWIAKDTYFLIKVEIDMVIELTPEAMGSPGEEGEATIDTSISMLAYNYNQPVSIELPPEAEAST